MGRVVGRVVDMSATNFDRSMADFAPFEPNPDIAVAVSGGPDSLALVLLAERWAKRQGGRVTGLTVDHGLREGSAREARQVGNWLGERHIEHRILKLKWPHKPPPSDIQGKARTARYLRLGDWCRTNGVLHLLVAHHAEDQAETFLLRLGRGSGVDGLSAMAAISDRSDHRILRPLLKVSKAQLVAALKRAGQQWIEDPSNEDLRHARARLRAALPALGDERLTVQRLSRTANAMSRARYALEMEVGSILARAATCDTAGFIRLSRATLTTTPDELALRIVARCLMTVSGQPYPPRLAALTQLLTAFRETAKPVGRTLAGCSITSKGLADDALLIVRELSATSPPVTLTPGHNLIWDGRFDIRPPRGLRARLRLGALSTLTANGRKAARMCTRADLPGRALASLPVLAAGSSTYLPRLFLAKGVVDGHLTGPVNGSLKKAAETLPITFRPSRPLVEIISEPEI